MINKILDGITTAIYSAFGDNYEIYTESIQQGLQEPCFFVMCINPTDKRWLGDRRKLTNQFSVQYFPASDEPFRECNAIKDRLTVALEYITFDERLHEGTGIQSTIQDGVLTVTVSYDFFAYRVEGEFDTMEELEQKGGLK